MPCPRGPAEARPSVMCPSRRARRRRVAETTRVFGRAANRRPHDRADAQRNAELGGGRRATRRNSPVRRARAPAAVLDRKAPRAKARPRPTNERPDAAARAAERGHGRTERLRVLRRARAAIARAAERRTGTRRRGQDLLREAVVPPRNSRSAIPRRAPRATPTRARAGKRPRAARSARRTRTPAATTRRSWRSGSRPGQPAYSTRGSSAVVGGLGSPTHARAVRSAPSDRAARRGGASRRPSSPRVVSGDHAEKRREHRHERVRGVARVLRVQTRVEGVASSRAPAG